MESLTTTSLVRGEEAIEHHGTKGMKWGQWNSETRRKYLGGKAGRAVSNAKKNTVKALGNAKVNSGKALSNASSKVMSFAKNKVEKAKADVQEKVAEKKAIDEHRKDLGMDKESFDKLRKTTLESHDPTIVAKGMHTLTDAELNAKITRLQREDQIKQLSTKQKQQDAQSKQARNQALAANPLVKVGDYAARTAIDRFIGGKTKGKKKDKEKNKGDESKEVKEEKTVEKSEFSRVRDLSEATKWNQIKKPNKAITGYGMKIEGLNYGMKSPEAKEASKKGKTVLEKNNDLMNFTVVKK